MPAVIKESLAIFSNREKLNLFSNFKCCKGCLYSQSSQQESPPEGPCLGYDEKIDLFGNYVTITCKRG